jgi:hypothetical protein
MKRLLLVLLVTATAIMAAGRPATLSAADCLYQRIHYYQYPNGPECGHTDFYCNDVIHSGCYSSYTRTSTGYCLCP